MSNLIYSYLYNCDIYKGLDIFFPEDVINIIIKYIYTRTDKSLLNDIENFVTIRTKLLNLYYNYYANPHLLLYDDKEQQLQVTEDRYHLITDLELYFLKNYNHNIWKRKFGLDTDDKIDKYLIDLDNTNIDRQINIYLGLLKSKERERFYNNCQYFKFI